MSARGTGGGAEAAAVHEESVNNQDIDGFLRSPGGFLYPPVGVYHRHSL